MRRQAMAEDVPRGWAPRERSRSPTRHDPRVGCATPHYVTSSRLTSSLKRELEEGFAAGWLAGQDVLPSNVAALEQMPPQLALQALQEFRLANHARIKHPAAYFSGVMKRICAQAGLAMPSGFAQAPHLQQLSGRGSSPPRPPRNTTAPCGATPASPPLPARRHRWEVAPSGHVDESWADAWHPPPGWAPIRIVGPPVHIGASWAHGPPAPPRLMRLPMGAPVTLVFPMPSRCSAGQPRLSWVPDGWQQPFPDSPAPPSRHAVDDRPSSRARPRPSAPQHRGPARQPSARAVGTPLGQQLGTHTSVVALAAAAAPPTPRAPITLVATAAGRPGGSSTGRGAVARSASGGVGAHASAHDLELSMRSASSANGSSADAAVSAQGAPVLSLPLEGMGSSSVSELVPTVDRSVKSGVGSWGKHQAGLDIASPGSVASCLSSGSDAPLCTAF